MKKQIQINNSTKFWLKQFPDRYIAAKPKPDMLRFDGGESFVPKTSNIEPLLDKIKTKHLMNYTEPSYTKLKGKIAKKQNVPVEQITISAGADELIENIPRILLEPGDKVIVITPTFFRFIESSLRLEAEIIEIKTKQSENFEINKRVINEVIEIANKEKVKLVWIATPNNPTGTVTDPRLIEKLVNEVSSFVVIDEVLHGFLDPDEHKSNKSLIENHENVLILGSISKIYGLAGIRVGWGIAQKGLIDIFEKWRLPYNIATPSMKVAIELFELNSEHKMRDAIWQEKQFIVNELAKLGSIEVLSDSMINILLVKHKNKDLFEELKKRGVLAADFRGANGLEGENCVRLSVQTHEKNRELVKILKEINEVK